ncbi:glycosyltransferase [uncultured Thiodictyon sp.]|uniref:tetratricopeptide repeat protein n=1 Tax=uncultured Thiodictyon sp. TaxID=1846217 RepID=UPI0025F57B74|nr:glycosyltransferase [uncultured Thiodictyon sp.]
MLIVQLCDFGVDGDAQYRMHAPSRALGAIPGVTAIDAHFAHPRVAEWIETADVVVIQFFNDWDLVSLCEQRRRAGKITVFEANDYFFDLQTWSPIGAAWSDQTVSELYARLLVIADGVQTSSAALADRWRHRGARQVAVFANQLVEVAPLPAPPKRPFTLGWAGSPGHFADWFAVAPVLSTWLAGHPDARLAVMTNTTAKAFFELPAERYQFQDFGSLTDYLTFLTGLDVGLAPLLPTEYNRCRSDVKFLEYASQGVVGIYADLDPYRGVVRPGETGLLYRTPDELVAGLDRLYQDHAYRAQLRAQAYDYVSRQRRLTDHIGERLAWYRALGASERGGENGYFAVTLSPSQNAARAALADPAVEPAAKRQQLEAELAREPRHLEFLLATGRLCNDLRQPQAAHAHLTQALQLMPASAQARSELARAQLLGGDPALARRTLSDTLSTTPDYLPGWQYLLRLDAVTHHAERSANARQAIVRFPHCYPLVLMAIEGLPPAPAALELTALLARMGATLSMLQRPPALTAVRNAVERLLKQAPLAGPTAAALLAQASVLFPESARLAGWHGEVLYRLGEAEQAIGQFARAAALRVAARVERDEFAAEAALPRTWLFAHDIAAQRERNP